MIFRCLYFTLGNEMLYNGVCSFYQSLLNYFNSNNYLPSRSSLQMADQKFFIANNLFFVPAQTNVLIRGIFVMDWVLRPRVRLAVRA